MGTNVTVCMLPVLMVIDDDAGVGEYTLIPNDIYQPIKQHMPIYCIDVVAINRAERVFYLAKRQRQPRSDWWWFGGRVGKDELPWNAGSRKLREELGLNIDPSRLTMVGVIFHYINEDGVTGTYPAIQFAVELTDAELASIRLESAEYDADVGIEAFNRQGMVDHGVNATVVTMYDHLFP